MASVTIPLIGGIWPGTAEMIYDYLGGAKMYMPDLTDVEMPIMSNGGSAVDGIRGYAALKDSGLRIVTKAPGGCDSAATLFFAAGEERVSSQNALFLCHNPYAKDSTMYGTGTADDHQATADELRMLEDSYANIYAAASNKDAEFWKAVMKTNKSITAQQAYEWGFVTSLSDSITATFDAKAQPFMAANNPERLSIMAEKNKNLIDNVLSRMGFGAKAEAQAESVALEGGGTLEVTGPLQVGAATTAADGEYTTTDGRVISVSNGMVDGIETVDEAEARKQKMAEAEAQANADADAAQEALIEAVAQRFKAQFDAMAAENAKLKAENAELQRLTRLQTHAKNAPAAPNILANAETPAGATQTPRNPDPTNPANLPLFFG